jgi:hypothetical protein
MPVQPLHLVWSTDTEVIHGFDLTTGAWIEEPVYLGIAFPGTTTNPVSIQVTSSGMRRHSYDVVTNIQLFLKSLPPEGISIQVSFDKAKTFQEISLTPITLPAVAIVSDAPQEGMLGPFDMAALLFRAVVSPSFSDYQIIDLPLGTTCDVV